MEKCCLPLLVMCFAVAAVYGLDTKGFISIDCGGTNNFIDDITKLTYTSDDNYIETGVSANIASNYMSNVPLRQFFSLRSFPIGTRNCYNLKPLVQNSTYLIRVAFFHGNYDSHFTAQYKKQIMFDIYIGASKWRTVNITDAGSVFWHEATIVALAKALYLCLINTGAGTPFINLLEMRPMNSPLYPYVTESQFADLMGRGDFGGSNITRYPDDKYDRIWYPMMHDEWTKISTHNEVKADYLDNYSELPSVVLQTAIVPSRSAPSSPNLNFYGTQQGDVTFPMAINFHFAEVTLLPNSSRREFNIYYIGRLLYEHVIPKYLKCLVIYTPKLLNIPSNSKEYGFALNVTSNSTEPALVNAFELFSVMPFDTKMTDPADHDAILAIKTEYKIDKGWTGDPCVPLSYSWVGVGCDYVANSSKIISLNLSSCGLTGPISSSFSKLQNIKILDLSNNGLNGAIPDFLATMNSLELLNLSGNSFNCDIPETLRKKSDSGVLSLVCDNKYTGNMPGKPIIFVIGLIIAAVVLVLLLVLFIVLWDKRGPGQFEIKLKTQKFTKTELKKITQNFTKRIGRGGSGDVFAGTLKDGTNVAVKKLSKSIEEGQKEFQTEVNYLAKLHHKNLLSLIGYCEEESCLALVYEYMPQGNLESHIRGTGRVLNWQERLHVCLQAAQGLEYLHKGCRRPIVHRDVKCSNILIGDNLEAKVSDLGLARAFRSSDQGTVTMVGGTIGYIDPEFSISHMLTVKSDVYSFGIVLLEMITGLPPITQGNCPLLRHVRQKLQSDEDVTSVIDGRFQGDYDINSVRKVLNLAMSCTEKESPHRPMMSDVVAVLKDCLDLETHRVKSQSNHRQNTDIHDRRHSDAFSDEKYLSINSDSMSQHNTRNESFREDYRSNGEADSEVMLGPSLR